MFDVHAPIDIDASLPRADGPAFRPDATHWVAPDERRLRAQSELRRIPLFDGVPPHHLREIAKQTRRETFAPGDEIIHVGEVGSTMYAIQSGQVQVIGETASHEPVVLATLGPGDVFGELSIFDREVRSATVVATQRTEALTLGQLDVVRMVQNNPETALSLLRALGARLRAANQRLEGPASTPH